jgi:DNA-directed RNA polymerase subunit RPC12/RpoP
MEKCENCGRVIGKLETPYVWTGNIVCAECHQRLSGIARTAAPATSGAASPFVMLNCPNCGGKLEVHNDIDRFACSHCGSEMVVERRGGTVSLQRVTEAIAKVQVGTDKTAAELAIVRYERRLEELRQHRKARQAPYESQLGCFGLLTLAASLIFFGLLCSGQMSWSAALGCLAFGFVGGVGCSRVSSRMNAELSPIKAEISDVERQLAEKQRIADG